MGSQNESAQQPVEEQILKNIESFATATAKTLHAFFSIKASPQKPQIINDGINLGGKVFVSILFTGTVYGEYVIALDQDVAVRLIKNSSQDQTGPTEDIHAEISDSLGEVLNVVVGECITGLGDVYKKLSMTSPRVYFGKLKYPRIKTGRAILDSEIGQIECYLYIDRMKLDITASYKEALASLILAHSNLQTAMTKLRDQQGLLVQSEKNAALVKMAAGVAHEINTPLATVCMLGAQLKLGLQGKSFDRMTFREMLNGIGKTTARIARITNALKAFAQGYNGKAFARISVRELIDDLIVLCDQHTTGRNVKLECGEIPESLSIECQKPEVTRVLVNLIFNACDAIENLEEKWIKIHIFDSEEIVEFRITDSGDGIPETIQQNIFDPFFTTKGLGKGTGLGLSISKGIIDDHGGTISIDQKCPHTCFVIRLPKSQSKFLSHEKSPDKKLA